MIVYIFKTFKIPTWYNRFILKLPRGEHLMKTCTKCKTLQPLSMYYRNKNTSDGYQCQCKDCAKSYDLHNKEALSISAKTYRLRTRESRILYEKEYRLRNKEALSISSKKAYYQNKEVRHTKLMANWERHMLKNTKAAAKRNNRECTLVLNDILIPEKCPYLNIPLTRTIGKGIVSTNASLDRIDSTKGYIPDNVQVISYLANTIKNNATKEQLIIFAKNILKIHPINRGE